MKRYKKIMIFIVSLITTITIIGVCIISTNYKNAAKTSENVTAIYLTKNEKFLSFVKTYSIVNRSGKTVTVELAGEAKFRYNGNNSNNRAFIAKVEINLLTNSAKLISVKINPSK